MFNYLKQQKGISIFLGLLVVTVFLVIGAGLATTLNVQRETTRDVLAGIQSRALSESGAEHVLLEGLKNNQQYFYLERGRLDGITDAEFKGTFEAGFYGFKIPDSSKEVYAYSIGSFEDSRVKRFLETGDVFVGIIPHGTSCAAWASEILSSESERFYPVSIGTDNDGLNLKFWTYHPSLHCSEKDGSIYTVMYSRLERCPEYGNNYADWAFCRMYRILPPFPPDPDPDPDPEPGPPIP
jgi:hypothetical protein